MAQNTEIIVDEDALNNSISKFSILEKNITNRKLDIKFTTAKGAVADELVEVAAKLKEIGQSLTMLVSQTRAVMELAKTSFKEADQQAKQKVDSIS